MAMLDAVCASVRDTLLKFFGSTTCNEASSGTLATLPAAQRQQASVLEQLRGLIGKFGPPLYVIDWPSQQCAVIYAQPQQHLYAIPDSGLERLRDTANGEWEGPTVQLHKHETALHCCRPEASGTGCKATTNCAGLKRSRHPPSRLGSGSALRAGSCVSRCWLEENLTAFLNARHSGACHPDLDVVEVDDNDHRKALRGQSKVVLARGCKLDALDVIGVYTGSVREASHAPAHAPILQVGQLHSFTYQFDPSDGSLICACEQLEAVKDTLLVQPYPTFSNKLMAINDSRHSGKPDNVKFVEFLHRGFPAVAMVATKAITDGEVVTTRYGSSYWRDHDVLESAYAAPLRQFGQEVLPLLGMLENQLPRCACCQQQRQNTP